MKQLTGRPVPVGGCTFEAAFFFEGGFESVYILAVPWKKLAREVDLFI